MGKRFIIVILAIALCISLFPMMTWAADNDFIIENGILIKYQGTDRNVVIPNGVTIIGDKAFKWCFDLLSVTIPYGVSSIGAEAFLDCSSLMSVSLPNSLTIIGEKAFNGCKKMTSVTVPSSVTSIGKNAFLGCTGLTAVYISDIAAWCNIDFQNNPLSTAHNLYLNGELVTKLTIPNSVSKIGGNAFSECSSLTSVTIPDSVTTIGDRAFSWCSSLTSVTIPGSVTVIGNGAFRQCTSLVNVTISEGVTKIGDHPTIYADGADGAFLGCKSLTGIKLPNSLTYISEYAFNGCSGLSAITIPRNVATIGVNAFTDCDSLQQIAVDANNETFCSVDGILYNKQKTELLACPGAKELVVSIPNSVIHIMEGAFRSCHNLTTVAIPNGVVSIGNYAFTHCESLSDISIPNGISNIGTWAFYLCDSLTDIEIPNSVISIGEEAFACSGLVNVTIADGVTSISNGIFSSCKGLTSVTIPNSLTSISDYAFSRCFSLTNAPIPDSVTSIGEGAFESCIGLTSVTIPDRVTSIGEYAFEYCESLTSVTIPNSVTNIYNYAFYGCAALRDVYYCGSEIQWSAVSISDFNGPLLQAQIHYEQVIITFDPNGGTVSPTSKPVTNGQPYGDLPTPTRKDYRFDGWFTAAIGGTQITASTTVDLTANQTLYAHWTNITAPVLTTNEATGITKTSATFSASVVDDGGDGDLTRQFVYWNKYSTASKYTVTADSNFQVTINNLSPDSEYYFYAKASNSAGDGIGNVMSFRTLSEDKPQSISVSPTYLSLQVGDSYQLLASVLPATAVNRNVVWSSSDQSVLRVDQNGKVLAVKEGEAVVKVTTEVNRLSASCTIKVSSNAIKGTFDFSEWNMATNTSDYATEGFDWDTVTGGGNYQIATAYLSRWDGAVLEENDPYRSYNGNPRQYYQEVDADYHIQEVVWIPERESSTDNSEIKAAIMNYGAIYESYQSYGDYYDGTKTNFYFPASGRYTNGGHAIAVVGWDDNYSSSHFKITPPGDGAFICKNSWSASRGENGYFYISYYDKYFGKNGGAAVPAIERNTNYNTIYQYDPYGACSALGYRNTTYAANIFPQKGSSLSKNETLRAVSFYTYFKNTFYEVYVVTNYQNSSSLQQRGTVVATGTMQDMGYHTVMLDHDVLLNAGTRFAVIVKLSVNGGYSYVYYEYPMTFGDGSGYSSKARANSDESYYSSNGNAWKDLTSYTTNANFCIKAFTDNGTAALSTELFSAVDNNNREYESEKVYTLEDALAEGIPINDEFVDWIRFRADNALLMDDSDDMSLGDIPTIIDMGTNTVSFVEGAILPSRFDLRDEGCVTAVRDQGNWGTCWAHAMYASLESCLLRQAKTVSVDAMGDTAGEHDFLALMGQYGIAATRLTISDEVAVLAVNAGYHLNASFEPANATESAVVWSSSNAQVVTVDTNGTLSTHKAGNATITASSTDGLLRATCNVTVVAGEPVKSVSLADQTVTKAVGDVFLVDYTINPAEASNQEVTWSSSNPAIVSVNENGCIRALRVGSATITITTKDGKHKDKLQVNVNDGHDYAVVDMTAHFARYAPNLFGSIEISLENRTEGTGPVSLYVAVYSERGQLLNCFNKTVSVSAGINSASFNNLVLENATDSRYRIKCFILKNGTFAPLASDMEKTIEI